MLKKFNKKLFGLIATVFAFIAATEIQSASFWTLYQPKAPESLKKTIRS
ncbi:cyclic lactone autoinducer peptide [Desulfolucanica intricata]|nr:cyclic lactone autoinducer peptide [Desulfolucanica intricata]